MTKEMGGKIPPEAPIGGMPKPIFLLSSNIGCDARYKWFQALGDILMFLSGYGYADSGSKRAFQDGVYERCIQSSLRN